MNSRKARTGLYTSKGILGKLFPEHEKEEKEHDKKCKDRTLAHKPKADWKERKRKRRRIYNKARTRHAA